MRAFWVKLFIVTAAILLITGIIEVLSYDDDYSMPIAKLTESDTYVTNMDGPDWIVPLIEKVSAEDESHVLLIGDSVCRQMFIDLMDINKETCVAPAVSPFGMCGQYVLVKQYLDSHPDATDVYLMMVPMGDVSHDFIVEYGYQYVVMPLVETDLLYLLDEKTIDELKYMFGEWSMKPSVVHKIDKSGLNRKLYLNYVKAYRKNDYKHSLEESVYIKYLKKIKALCDERSVKLHFLSDPIPDTELYHGIVEKEVPELFVQTGLYDMFPEYLESVRFYPEELFDGIHFKGKYDNRENYDKIIREMYTGYGLMEVLHLSKNEIN